MKTISKKAVRERLKEMFEDAMSWTGSYPPEEIDEIQAEFEETFAIVDRVLEWTPAKEVVAAAVVVGKERKKKDGNHEVER